MTDRNANHYYSANNSPCPPKSQNPYYCNITHDYSQVNQSSRNLRSIQITLLLLSLAYHSLTLV
ncbi:hypothetical protein PtA15_16A109 [Puccinia triticina]|uniref:Uncharacterized protein n=1 Tax=Puccinia triticina TaxID=208348 RepID=A0ABY7D6I2_9BASI|nr:uncharacterized protein PtA15_16A109 [Puccinia triticina]WAQ92203.1 hypothetical protein PtA15_16A109 [Puccinia triticina]